MTYTDLEANDNACADRGLAQVCAVSQPSLPFQHVNNFGIGDRHVSLFVNRDFGRVDMKGFNVLVICH